MIASVVVRRSPGSRSPFCVRLWCAGSGVRFLGGLVEKGGAGAPEKKMGAVPSVGGGGGAYSEQNGFFKKVVAKSGWLWYSRIELLEKPMCL